MRKAAISLATFCAIACASGCGNTLQDQPIAHDLLETLVVAPIPVYWLGASFHGLAATGASHDPGGAYTLEYGDCLEGGQGSCVRPLQLVSSPDNSFVPGESAPHTVASVRGVRALVLQGGRTIVLATGRIVVSIFANNARLASEAAAMMVPIDGVGAPEVALPHPFPNTGYERKPFSLQVPSPVHPLSGDLSAP